MTKYFYMITDDSMGGFSIEVMPADPQWHADDRELDNYALVELMGPSWENGGGSTEWAARQVCRGRGNRTNFRRSRTDRTKWIVTTANGVGDAAA